MVYGIQRTAPRIPPDPVVLVAGGCLYVSGLLRWYSSCVCPLLHHTPRARVTLGGDVYCWSFSFFSPSTHHFTFPFYCTNSIITIHYFPQVVCVDRRDPADVLFGGAPCCAVARNSPTHTHSQCHGQRGRWLKCVCISIKHRILDDQRSDCVCDLFLTLAHRWWFHPTSRAARGFHPTNNNKSAT